ncbi:insulin-induced gene 1 protein [Arapaima gigas]
MGRHSPIGPRRSPDRVLSSKASTSRGVEPHIQRVQGRAHSLSVSLRRGQTSQYSRELSIAMSRLEERWWSCPCSPGVKPGSSWLPPKVAEAVSAVSSVLRGLRAAGLVRRGLVLFTVGVLLALVLNLLQTRRHVSLFPEEVVAPLFSSAWWIPPCCGTAAAIVGLLYPCIDSHLGEPHKFKREWASVMRCIAVFVGINHASAKLDFANNVQLSMTLAALSLGLWWTFDRSRSGFGLGITIAFLATLITQFLVYNGVYQYTSPDFLYIRSWLPCIFFSGGVTVGNIGRQLAMGGAEKPHSD